MRKDRDNLGDFGDLADWGEVNPIWGYMVGGGISGASMLVFKALGKKYPNLAKHAGLWGGVVGLVGSGVAMIFPSTRRAGYLGAVGTLFTALPEVVRSLVLVPQGLGDYDMGYTSAEFADSVPAIEIQGVPGLGAPAPVQVLQGAGGQGLGLTTADLAGVQGW
jgi:hypothetical protein